MKKQTPKQYRQGDVFFQRIDSIPTTATKQKNDSKVILAHGEVTGHHHSFDVKDAEEYRDAGKVFLHVTGRLIQARLPIVRQWKNQVMVNHPEFGMLEFAKQDVTIEDGHVVIEGRFGLLTHQEHTVQAWPAGDYVGGVCGQARQREYTPQAIRNVAD